ncbi:MAG: STAS domain-containing protein [Planctomycetes bacterium]|nr:STAS domain-containing protein [Planctomycetota bacterium]
MNSRAGAIAVEAEGDVTIVHFRENQVKGEEYTRLASDELKKLVIEAGGKVIVSLGNVRFISSAGMSTLLLFSRLLRSVQGQLKLCDIQPLVRQVFVAGGFSDVFDIHDTKADALAAFAQEA